MRYRPRSPVLLLVSALVLGLPVALDAAPRLPDWALTGRYQVEIPVGFGSVDGTYGYDLGDFNANVSLRYGRKNKLSGGGSTGEFGTILYGVDGTWDIDPATGRTRIRIANAPKKPTFSFEGVMSEDRLGFDGTFTRGPGFGGTDVTDSGPMRLGRVPPVAAQNALTLRFQAAQSLKGKVSAAREQVVGAKAPLTEATLSVFGGETLTGGRVSGKVKSSKDGTTFGRLTVKGKGWRVRMKGPVDADGFHAIASVKTSLLRFKDVALTLPVEDGPEQPPPPPPSAPKNLLDGAVARIAGGQITITRENSSKKHFKKRADLTIQFPLASGLGTIHANPPSAIATEPIRFFFDQRGGRTYGAAAGQASVRLDIERLALTPGETIQVHAVGETYSDRGKRILVDVIVLARVAP